MLKISRSHWRPLFRTLVFWRSQLPKLIILCVLLVASGFLDAYPVKLSKSIIDSASSSSSDVFARLPWLVAAFYMCNLISGGILAIIVWISSIVEARVCFLLRGKVYEHMLTLSIDFFDKHKTGDLMSRAIEDAETSGNSLLPVLNGFVLSMTRFSFATYYLATMSWQLGILCLPSALLIGFVTIGFRGAISRTEEKVRQAQGEIWSKIRDTIASIREIQAFGREEQEKRNFGKMHDDICHLLVKKGWINNIIGAAQNALTPIAIALILWQGTIRLHQGTLSMGELTAFIMYVSIFLALFQNFSNIFGVFLQEVRVSSERVVSVLDSRSSVPEAVEGKILDNSIHNVVFDDVSFGYDPENIVLHDLSFAVNAGESIALVGPSGAGKTTIAKLVMRFYDPLKGSVTINGEDLRDLDLHFLRHHIGTVFQDPFLANATVWENIAYGKPDASESEIIEVAKAAESHEFIEELPNSYDTVIGEQGSRLSGGQRQRLAIARVMLKSPSVIILDEATSSLDSETETKIYTALRRLLSGRTSFIIAHRLSTVVEASKIAVINEGNLVEIGNHHELINLNGMYKKFYDIQFSKPIQRWVEKIKP